MNKPLLGAEDILYFMHVPKTGGKTLANALKAYFPPHQVCPYELIQQLMRLTPEELRLYRFISGHHFYTVDQLLGRKPVYITLIRHPVEWMLSNYAYIARTPEHRQYDLFRSKSLPELLRDPQYRLMLKNSQTRYLAATPDLQATAELVRALEPGNLQAEAEITARMQSVSEATMLDIARQRLQEFAFVGVTDRLNNAILVISHLFGWKPPETIDSLNVSPSRPDITPEVLEAMDDLIRLDLQLYDYAVQLYENTLQRTLRSLFGKIEDQAAQQESLTLTLQQTIEDYRKEVMHLQQIENSQGWRWVLRWRRLRSAITSLISPLRMLYNRLRK